VDSEADCDQFTPAHVVGKK